MFFLRATVLGLAAVSLAAPNQLPNVLFKDVAIIGGGASGAYAGVRLRDDYGKSIALIEAQDHLGGMVDTYTDPKSDEIYVERAPMPHPNIITEYIDFCTGELVNYTTPPFETQLGYWNFPQPGDIQEDLLIPFGEFITKHGLEDAAPLMYQSSGFGIGNMTRATTMFELQSFGTYMAQYFLGIIHAFCPASGGNQALYNAIGMDLGDDVLYSSTVLDSNRTRYGVCLTVQNHATGQITLVAIHQLLIAIVPTDKNMASLDLDRNEKALLSKFSYTREYTGIVDNSALAARTLYFNMASDAAPDNYLIPPDLPFTHKIAYLGGDHLFEVSIAGDGSLDETDAKSLAQRSFKTLLQAGHLEESEQEELDWVAFSVHGAMHARVTPEDVQNGFFQQLYALEGQRSTWWTGAAFSCDFQTTLWDFDETLIPNIVASIS